MKNTYAILRNLCCVSLFLLFCLNAFSQGFPVTGKVMDANGAPLPGVTVQVKGTNTRVVTKDDGSYQITAPSSNATLIFSYVGFTEQQAPIRGSGQHNIALQHQANSLESVVVVGYGTQKKKNVTNAVSTYNAEDIAERPVARVDQALVGQMAGVQVKQTTGTPGKAFSIQVRGTGSISAGNDPLYVIDGFPLATAAAGGSGSYSSGNPLDNINPNDIESIQVLKDAAAAAIYGSRGGNGVVLITTKRGKLGKPKVGINAYAGYTERNRKLDMLNGPEWIERAIEMINAAYVFNYGKVGAKASDDYETRRQILKNPPPGTNVINLNPGDYNTSYMLDPRWSQPGYPGLRFLDWQDETFRKGIVQNYQLSVNGGNEFVKYYMSVNYADQEGMLKGMDYKAYTGRANLEISPVPKLKIGINVSPTYSITNDPGVEGKDNILHQLLSFTPVQEDTMGLYPNIGKNAQYRWSTSANSPVGKLESIIGRTARFRTITSFFGEWQPIKGMTFRTTFNLDNTDNSSKGYTPYNVAGNQNSRNLQITGLNSGSFNGYRKQTFVNENTLNYNKVLADVHDLSLLAGTSYNTDKIDNVRVSSTGGFTSGVITTLNAANAWTGSTTEARNVLISYFGRVQYSYQSKYLLSASFRTDGSSRFGQLSKWGNFPSASLGWRVSEEDFMKSVTPISDLKLRASYGQSGNNNIGDYPSIPTIANYSYAFNSTTAIGQAPNRLANPSLAWEKSTTFDVGFDLGLLRNRITSSFDYYIKKSSSLLFNVPTLAVSGFQSFFTNAAKLENRGYEVELTTRNFTGRFQWTTTANFTHNENEIKELSGGQQQIILPSAYGDAFRHAILRVGEPLNSIYVIRQTGILSQDDIDKKVPLYGAQTVGDPKYLDADGNGVINDNDRVIVGHPNPDYTWGVTNNFRFAGFDLTVLVQGQWGGSIYSLLGRALGRVGQGASDNALGFYRNRWRSPQSPGEGRVAKVYTQTTVIANTDWLYKSDYIRVRNISLGYDLAKLIKTKHMSGARIYATLENFFGYDVYKGGLNPEANNTDVSGSGTFPEAGDYGGLPLPRSFIVGLNLNF